MNLGSGSGSGLRSDVKSESDRIEDLNRLDLTPPLIYNHSVLYTPGGEV